MAELPNAKHQWPKWLFLTVFVPLILATQYRRLQTWIILEELETENEFLKERLPGDLLARLCNSSSMLPPEEAKPSSWAKLTQSVGCFFNRWAPGDEERSGIPTYIFLFLMAIYLWRIFKWVCSELRLYSRLDEGNDQVDGRYSLVNFFSYRADFWLSTNTYAKPIALGSFTLVLILIGAALRCLLTAPTMGTSLWDCWIFVVDTSAHADEESTAARLSALLMTVGGMFIFAMMIGLISDGLAAQLDSLASGSAGVLEYDHIVILGWSNKLMPLIRELTLANMSAGGCVITILAEQEKAEMEELVEASGLDLRGCKVVCRKGSPTVNHDLEHVSVKSARVIIVLSPSGESGKVHAADEADGYVLRVLLCLKGMDCVGHVVAELQDIDNQALIHIVGGTLVESVVAHDFIGRLIVQSGRQPGLAQVMETLLGFGGHEFYMKSWPELVGKRFGDVLFQFKDAIPLGILAADETCTLNPPNSYRMKEGDVLIVLAEDDDTYAPATNPFKVVEDVERCTLRPPEPAGDQTDGPDNTLILGWRRDLGDILSELNDNVPPGSKVTLLCDRPNINGSRDRDLASNGRSDPKTFQNLRVEHVEGNQVCRYDLERLNLRDYRTAFILHEEGKGYQEADSCIVTSLFLLRDVYERQMRAAKVEYRPLTVISEVLDPRTRLQLSMAGVRDFVMSNEVVSAALAMVAECRAVNRILKELLSAAGCEIYIRPVSQYCPPGISLNFFDMMVAVRKTGAILLGQVLEGHEVELNPTNKVQPRIWAPDDKLVILSES
eukprot:GGOE01019386.1.p1 GENE.GGOE01019386.1~~GGOE01019386.1.p1  ORF type:complete len:792 (+),score=259.72 GGOE01019386.1:35-2377(+)